MGTLKHQGALSTGKQGGPLLTEPAPSSPSQCLEPTTGETILRVEKCPPTPCVISESQDSTHSRA